jgi:hypothetical protein
MSSPVAKSFRAAVANPRLAEVWIAAAAKDFVGADITEHELLDIARDALHRSGIATKVSVLEAWYTVAKKDIPDASVLHAIDGIMREGAADAVPKFVAYLADPRETLKRRFLRVVDDTVEDIMEKIQQVEVSEYRACNHKIEMVCFVGRTGIGLERGGAA